MTDEQKARIAEALTSGVEKLVAWVERTGGFAEEQAPIVAREIVNAGLVRASSPVVAVGVVMMVFMWLVVWTKRQGVKHYGDPCVYCERSRGSCSWNNWPGLTALFYTGIVVMLCIEIGELSKLIAILVAPRLYVLEHLRAML